MAQMGHRNTWSPWQRQAQPSRRRASLTMMPLYSKSSSSPLPCHLASQSDPKHLAISGLAFLSVRPGDHSVEGPIQQPSLDHGSQGGILRAYRAAIRCRHHPHLLSFMTVTRQANSPTTVELRASPRYSDFHPVRVRPGNGVVDGLHTVDVMHSGLHRTVGVGRTSATSVLHQNEQLGFDAGSPPQDLVGRNRRNRRRSP